MAKGRSVVRGLEELRVKESDRITTMAEGLRLIGAKVEELEDGLIIEGRGGDPLPGGGPIATKLDHRIAMSFAVAGLVSRDGVVIDRSEEHTSELQSLLRISYAVFCLDKQQAHNKPDH